MPLILYLRTFRLDPKTVDKAKGTLFIYAAEELKALKSLKLPAITELNESYKLLKVEKEKLLTQVVKANLRDWFKFPSSGSHLRGQMERDFIFKSTKYKEPSYTFKVLGII